LTIISSVVLFSTTRVEGVPSNVDSVAVLQFIGLQTSSCGTENTRLH